MSVGALLDDGLVLYKLGCCAYSHLTACASLNPVAGIWIMSPGTLQAWPPHAVCSLVAGHCHFLTTLAPSFRTSVVSTLLELFVRFKKTVFKIPEISRRKKRCWMGSLATYSQLLQKQA